MMESEFCATIWGKVRVTIAFESDARVVFAE